jgi:hypothetical protein
VTPNLSSSDLANQGLVDLEPGGYRSLRHSLREQFADFDYVVCLEFGLRMPFALKGAYRPSPNVTSGYPVGHVFELRPNV